MAWLPQPQLPGSFLSSLPEAFARPALSPNPHALSSPAGSVHSRLPANSLVRKPSSSPVPAELNALGIAQLGCCLAGRTGPRSFVSESGKVNRSSETLLNQHLSVSAVIKKYASKKKSVIKATLTRALPF